VIEPAVYEVGDVTVDLRRMTVVRLGSPVPLEPKTFDVLCCLLAHRERVVSRDELLDAVWKDTFVTPNVLSRAIAQLRKALGDDAFESRYIETVSKRGYRLIAAVRIANGHDSPATPSADPPDDGGPTRLETPVPVRSTRRRWLAGAGVVVVVVSAAAASVLVRRSPSDEQAAPASITLQFGRLTSGSASCSFPAVSPDGRVVAYSSDRTGSNEIYVVGAAQGSREQQVTADGGENVQASWSPDGQWLAYHSARRGGVWLVQSTGGTPRQLTASGAQPAWSPDGRAIAFADGLASSSAIWTVNRDGSNVRQLRAQGLPAGGYVEPAWSHDGRSIAFTVVQGPIVQVWAVPVAGGKGRRLADRAASARFAPRDEAVYAVSRTPARSDSLVRVPLDAAGKAADAPRVVFTPADSFISGLSLASDGTVVLALERSSSNIWAVSLAGGRPAGDPFPLTDDEVRNTLPSFARDGRLAYSQVVTGQPVTTWVMDAGGRNRAPLTGGMPETVLRPQWSPDGTRLFVAVMENERTRSLAWLDAVTRRITALAVDPSGITNFGLSPDGAEIAFHLAARGGTLNVWTQRLDGGPRRQVTFDQEGIGYPQWSPDGRWLAVEIMRSGETQVGVVSRDGGPVDQLTSEPGQSWPNGWAPDNDRVVFAGERGGVWNLYAVSRRTKAVTPITRFTSVAGYVRFPAWSPRGDRIAFERATVKSSLWMARVPGNDAPSPAVVGK
jgi:Tol biopolymer transport system component/DNA-binding winged helix-turn-helix (wHTH) protein